MKRLYQCQHRVVKQWPPPQTQVMRECISFSQVNLPRCVEQCDKDCYRTPHQLKTGCTVQVIGLNLILTHRLLDRNWQQRRSGHQTKR